MEERRKSKRTQAHLHVQWETHSSVREATVTNCSVHGCFVQAEVEEPGNEPVKPTIQLPNGASVELWGTVAFHLPTLGFGLHFKPRSRSPQDRLTFDRWRNYVEEQRERDLVIDEPSIVTAA
jgi:PilZ domain-containing protein